MRKLIDRIILTIIIVIVSINSLYSGGLLFKPLTANVFEPRTGMMYQFNSRKLRLDIGTSADLFELQKTDRAKINIGTDFFTFSRLRSEGNMKFPVETTDFFFGINITGKSKLWGKDISGRLRLSHISSHLVDGMANGIEFSQEPFVYSREFLDLVGTITVADIRFYAGLSYIFSTIPKDVITIIPQLGFDYEYGICPLMSFAAGYDVKLGGTKENYDIVHVAQAGILLKASESTGIYVSYYLYRGPGMHGMFYQRFDYYHGIGFQVVFY